VLAQKRLFRSSRSKIRPRHSLSGPRFPVRRVNFHHMITFAEYISCFCAWHSFHLVTLTAHVQCHVTCTQGFPQSHTKQFFDPEFFIHYTTCVGLRWRLGIVYIEESPWTDRYKILHIGCRPGRIHACQFCEDRLRGFVVTGGRILAFSIDLLRRL